MTSGPDRAFNSISESIWTTHVGSNTRVLFRRGQTFDVGASSLPLLTFSGNGTFDNVFVGAFGTGPDPVLPATPNSRSESLFNTNSGSSNITISGIDYARSSATGSGNFSEFIRAKCGTGISVEGVDFSGVSYFAHVLGNKNVPASAAILPSEITNLGQIDNPAFATSRGINFSNNRSQGDGVASVYTIYVESGVGLTLTDNSFNNTNASSPQSTTRFNIAFFLSLNRNSISGLQATGPTRFHGGQFIAVTRNNFYGGQVYVGRLALETQNGDAGPLLSNGSYLGGADLRDATIDRNTFHAFGRNGFTASWNGSSGLAALEVESFVDRLLIRQNVFENPNRVAVRILMRDFGNVTQGDQVQPRRYGVPNNATIDSNTFVNATFAQNPPDVNPVTPNFGLGTIQIDGPRNTLNETKAKIDRNLFISNAYLLNNATYFPVRSTWSDSSITPSLTQNLNAVISLQSNMFPAGVRVTADGLSNTTAGDPVNGVRANWTGNRFSNLATDRLVWGVSTFGDPFNADTDNLKVTPFAGGMIRD